jgi:hypothetical protein
VTFVCFRRYDLTMKYIGFVSKRVIYIEQALISIYCDSAKSLHCFTERYLYYLPTVRIGLWIDDQIPVRRILPILTSSLLLLTSCKLIIEYIYICKEQLHDTLQGHGDCVTDHSDAIVQHPIAYESSVPHQFRPCWCCLYR